MAYAAFGEARHLNAEKTEQFLRLLSAAEHDVYRYIFALVPDIHAARDVYQETTLDLWKKFDQYDPAKPFVPWACRFAYMQVLRLRKTRRSSGIFLSQQALENIGAHYLSKRQELDWRRQALVNCLEKLPESSRKLIYMRYSEGRSIADIAQRTKRSVHTLYKHAAQIRQWLMDCTQRALEAEELQ